MKMSAMDAPAFEVFSEQSKSEYSRQRAHDSGLSAQESRTRTDQDFQRLLPQGQQTPDHFFYNLQTDESENIGFLWFGPREIENRKSLFIYDIWLKPNWRGQGLGKFMLDWLEEEAARRGLSEITLHVWGHNRVARRLYESVGYAPTSLYMSKKVAPRSPT